MPPTQSFNPLATITDQQSMGHSQSNPTHQQVEPDECVQAHEQPEQPNPHSASAIESIFPTADANKLLELIAQGHNADDLQELIKHSKKAA